MLSQNKASSESYERLRSWYLANLRTAAVTDLLGLEGSSMTPATLIDADSELMQKLAFTSDSFGQKPTVEKAPPASKAKSEWALSLTIATILVACALALPFLL